jgi:hypothetical protein
MSGHSVSTIGVAALVLTLGCSGGDLTLPDPNEPAALEVVSGDAQQAEPGASLQEPLTVRLLDGSSRPVRQTPVQFSFLGDLPGARLDPASVWTDEEGRAAANVRLGRVVGEQVIVARVTTSKSSELRARFSATAVPPDRAGGGKKGKDGGSDGVGD